MKWGLAFALILILLVSGCTESGMVTGGNETCRIVIENYTGMGTLDSRVVEVKRDMSWSRDLGYYAEGTVSLRNMDNESGWFVVTFNWFKPGQGMPYTQKVSRHLDPGDVGEFKSVCPDIDPQQGIFFLYQHDSYPDSKRTVEKYIEKKVCE